jgi:hypothetical protein
MKSYRILACALAAAALLAVSPSHAQTPLQTAAMNIAAPIVTKIIGKIISPQEKTPPGDAWLKAEVIHADAQTIIVREQDNGMAIHTFNFSPELHDRMQAILDSGGFQYGDRIGILYMPGQTVALRIHGKPSKSF